MPIVAGEKLGRTSTSSSRNNKTQPMLSRFLTIAILTLLTASCSERTQSKPSNESAETPGSTLGPATLGDKGSGGTFWQKLEMKEFTDSKGTVVPLMPFPATWKINQGHSQGKPSITGPYGVKITDFPAQSFMDNYDPSLQRAYAQGGQPLRSMPGVDQLIQQDIVPWLASNGFQYVRHYEIPEISKMDKWYSDQLYKAMPSRSDVVAIGTDWVSTDGRPYFLLIHLNVSTSQTMQYWYYMCTGLEAEPEHFQKAKKQLIFALSNTRYNLQPIMAYNQEEARRVGQSWAAHNERMIRNQAAFEASQRAHVNRSNAINEAIMSGWRERNAASDRNHEQFIDGIYERTNVVDPSTGQGYKVAAGANQYWMNSNGEYIGTDLQDYNPNLDENMNEIRWQELKELK